ncbi:hypothetical protein BT96DRAFT_1026088 [Gymnopus androsaceus JB14]|uniref:eIF3 subunit M C-terminal helix domain-containing protein n=1 Tax=Gymnopus androsaceus JB14 TaxID=1447944 RepID=A0A6A4GNE4_9AGAR|nr:hypothetical protein BT96DRAFT_1026088 [Gymnopus androsaceus JB14]
MAITNSVPQRLKGFSISSTPKRRCIHYGESSRFSAWEKSHAGALAKHGLEIDAQLERKIRLLTLASLVLKWKNGSLMTPVIRAGLLSGKLSQNSQTLHVIRATARTFEREQWQALEQRLLAWKSGLSSVLEVVATAKKQGGHASQVVAAAT